jgi:hypothetical protein
MNSQLINRFKMPAVFIVMLFFTFQLTGCSSVKVGRDFDVELFNSSAKVNITSMSQVKSWLGEPSSTGISLDKDGELSDEWMYFYGAGTLSDMQKAKLKILQVRFNKKGVLNSYNWSNSK